jgi:hypothetical protein
MIKAIVVLILLAAAFAGGYLPNYFELSRVQQDSEAAQQRIEQDLDATHQQLRLAMLQANLAMVLVEAERTNFGTAREHSTAFFNALNETIAAETTDARRESLSAIAQSRDEITAGLAASDAAVAEKLRDLFLRLSQDAKVGWPAAKPAASPAAQ